MDNAVYIFAGIGFVICVLLGLVGILYAAILVYYLLNPNGEEMDILLDEEQTERNDRSNL